MTTPRPTADAIRLSPDDNVATALRPIEAGETVTVRAGHEFLTVTAAEPIPLCHKISLRPIAQAAGVTKYGQRIGSATVAIAAGGHVHVHNMRSDRAQAGGGRAA